MSLPLPRCAACGTAAFPPRLLCPRCGCASWRDEPVENGIVEGVTMRDETRIGEIRIAGRLVVIARLPAPVEPGAHVSLEIVDSVLTVTPLGGRWIGHVSQLE